MAKNTVRLVFTGDNRSAIRAMVETADTSEKTGKKIKDQGEKAAAGFDKVGESTGRLRGAVGNLIGLAGLGGVAFGFADAIKAGQRWQQQQAQLQQTLKNTHEYSKSTMASINASAEKSSLHGGFAASDQIGTIARFTAETHNSTLAIRLNAAAMNLARGTGKDYASSAMLVQRAMTGTVGRLSAQVGPILAVKTHVDALTSAQKKLNPLLFQHAQLLDKQATAQLALAAIQKAYGGQTDAFSHTTAGALSNAKNAIDLLTERIGSVFLPYVAKAAQWLAKMAGVVQKDWPQISAVAKRVFGNVKDAISPVIGFFEHSKGAVLGLAAGLTTLVVGFGIAKVVSTFSKALDIATASMTALRGATLAEDEALLANPIGLVVVAIAALAAGTVYAYNHFKTFRTVVQGVFGWVSGAVTSVVGFVGQHWKLLLGILAGPFVLLPLLVITHFNQVKNFVGGIIDWVASKIGGLVKTITHLFGSIVGLPGRIVGDIGHFVSHPFGLHAGGLVPGFSSGGLIGGYGSRDTTPIMATPGEYVMNKRAVQNIGAQNLNSINQSGSLAGAGQHGDIQITPAPVTLTIGKRVLAEALVEFAAKRVSLG